MTSKKLFLAIVFLFLSFNAQAEVENRSELDFWGAVAPSTTSSSKQNYQGFNLRAGIEFPSLETDRQTVRLSVARVFNKSSIDRYNLAIHIGYDITSRFNMAVLGGVEYIQLTSPSTNYLKPLIGAEAVYTIKNFGKQALFAFVAYEVAQGSTGTLALNGGPSSLSASILSAGLMFSFSVLQGQSSE